MSADDGLPVGAASNVAGTALSNEAAAAAAATATSDGSTAAAAPTGSGAAATTTAAAAAAAAAGGAPGASAAAPEREGGTENGAEEEEEETHENMMDESVEEMTLERLKGLTEALMENCNKAVGLALTIAKACGTVLTSNNLVLPQAVTTLNCCLFHLVGPRCLELKVSNFQQYRFKPRELLAQIAEIYLCLSDDTSGGVCVDELGRTVVSEGRFYRLDLFVKASNIMRREGLVTRATLDRFDRLRERLAAASQSRNEEEELLASAADDMPEEFLDPVMQELMSDPVKLPSSGKVMDRKHIERILLSDESDPFNRMPLKKEALVPQEDLRAAISSFIEALRVKKRQRQTGGEAKEEEEKEKEGGKEERGEEEREKEKESI
eukprot:GHVU01231015.1.p1 GENE.GHVU01231015.1~~GHVU01231015.1.p1  ORF type:complete len:432 (+),score=147.24 GHVU01231015.1:157-1296(+)